MFYATVEFSSGDGVVVGTFGSRSEAYRAARKIRDEQGGRIKIVDQNRPATVESEIERFRKLSPEFATGYDAEKRRIGSYPV